MIFCCAGSNSSKHRKSMKKIVNKPIDSSSMYSASYASISSSSIPKSDSGFSENSSTRELSHSFEQLIVFEKIYYQHLKENLSKYSRPLRRYLHPEEIVQLFQNIEKISAISEGILRQCQTTLASNHLLIYQSWSGILIDSYRLYLLRHGEAQRTLKQCQEKIAYFLQMPVEVIRRDIHEFLLLPIRHITQLDQFFQSFSNDYVHFIDNFDRTFLHGLKMLAEQATFLLQPCSSEQGSSSDSSDDLTLLPETSSIVVLKRTHREPWEPKRVELLDSRLVFTTLDRSTITSSLSLSNVVHIREDPSFEQIELIVAESAKKTRSVYLRFEHGSIGRLWSDQLAQAIQQAKDRSWSQNKELFL